MGGVIQANGGEKEPLLSISKLRVHFDTMDGPIEALHDVSLSVEEGQIMGVVGESGCGKSVTSLTTIGLATCKVDEGSIKFNGNEMIFKDSKNNDRLEKTSTRVSIAAVFLSIFSLIWALIEPVGGATLLFFSFILLAGGVVTSYMAKRPFLLYEKFMRTIRGNEISMIFQEPMTALNPLYPVEKQISEVMMEHDRLVPRDIPLLGLSTPLKETRISRSIEKISSALGFEKDNPESFDSKPFILPLSAVIAIPFSLQWSLAWFNSPFWFALLYPLTIAAFVLLLCIPLVKSRLSRALMSPVRIIIDLVTTRALPAIFTLTLISMIIAQGVSGPFSQWDEISVSWSQTNGDGIPNGASLGMISWLLVLILPMLATMNTIENRAQHAISLLPSSFSLALVLYLALWVPFSVFVSIIGVFAMFVIPSIVVSDYLKLDPSHRDQVVEILKQVQIPNPEAVVSMYPHELSGGMRQRVMIAMMMSCEPKLLIADEPTTALDVTIQAQILSLMRDLRREKGTAIMLITHDLGVIAEMCDYVTVMYAGRVVERAPISEIFSNPSHAYTRGLLASSPRIDSERKSELPAIPGQVAQPSEFVRGCRFCQRMGRTGKTLEIRPEMREINPGHWVEDCPLCVSEGSHGGEEE